jgi:hypothetical protein
MNDLTDQLTALFEQAGKAHHQAYLATNGADPEWPMWYADYLMDKLPPLLGTAFTKSELVYLLVHLNKEQTLHTPDAKWPRYYAQYFVEHYS